jgi:hypothetical protein
MVAIRATRVDKLIPDRDGERQVGKAAPMEMAQFAPPDAELNSAETMRRRCDPFP